MIQNLGRVFLLAVFRPGVLKIPRLFLFPGIHADITGGFVEPPVRCPESLKNRKSLSHRTRGSHRAR
jgi:hypothetical protein